MSREEFISRLGQETRHVSKEDWEVIETVYNFHPSISNTEGKDQVALLYKVFGMRILRDMLDTAIEARTLEQAIILAKKNLEEAEDKYQLLKH